MSALPPDLPALPAFEDSAARACEAHPARAASAICRRCLKSWCAECVTKSEQVNVCAACLAARNAELIAKPGARAVRAAEKSATRAGILGTPARLAAGCGFYAVTAIAAATYGVAMPFLENERRLEQNRERITEVQLAVTAYYDDTGSYPSPDRGLDALLRPGDDDRATWRGPYVTARAPNGRGPENATAKEAVLDVFGRDILYYAKPSEDTDNAMDVVYIASRGANGAWDTAGVETGGPPHEPAGDDVLKWIVW